MRPMKMLIKISGLECANAQADMNRRWAHMAEGTFFFLFFFFLIVYPFNAFAPEFASRKHAYIILAPLNPTFI